MCRPTGFLGSSSSQLPRKDYNQLHTFYILSNWYFHISVFLQMLQPRTKPVETHFENTYFFRWPWEKGLSSQIKRPFPLSPFAMLFAITKEMHTGAVRPKQHCNREGGEFVPFGHEDCMARNWKLLWNVSTVLSGVVAFPFFVDMLDSIQHGVKKTCHVVQDVGHLMSFQNVLFT